MSYISIFSDETAVANKIATKATDYIFKNGWSWKSQKSLIIIILFLLIGTNCYSQKIVKRFGNRGVIELVDETGRLITNEKFDLEYGITDSVALVYNFKGQYEKNQKYYLVHLDGTTITLEQSEWGRINSVGEGLYSTQQGFINKFGEVVIPGFIGIGGFEDGKLLVKAPAGNFAKINTKGDILMFFDYEEMEPFGRYGAGLSLVRLDKKYGFVDINGNIIIPCVLELVHGRGFADSDIIWVRKDGVDIQIDKTGQQLKQMIYNPESFSEGLTFAHVDFRGSQRPIGFIDKKENIVIKTSRPTRNFKEGFAAISGNNVNFIDKTGKNLLSTNYYEIMDFSNGYAFINAGDNRRVAWGCVDRTGEIIILPTHGSLDEAKRQLTLLLSHINPIEFQVSSTRTMSNHKTAIKSLTSLAKLTKGHSSFKTNFPNNWNKSMIKIYNELGWRYYESGDYSKSAKTYALSKSLDSKMLWAVFGETLALCEQGIASTFYKGDTFKDDYLQALQALPKNKKTNLDYKAKILNEWVIHAYQLARNERKYEDASIFLNRIGLQEVVSRHFLSLASSPDNDFFTFRDLISNVYPKDINFDIDYFDESQLKNLFTQLENKKISSESVLKYKFELLDRLPLITSDISVDYEKAKFDQVEAGNLKQHRDYVERFPNGSYTKNVQRNLDLMDDNFYRGVVGSKEGIPYLRYLALFPNGKYASDAKLQISSLSNSHIEKLTAERLELEREEKDAISKYIKVVKHDYFLAEGDGLNFMEWLTSGSVDKKNWNVFVIARIRNDGELPKRIKATITLNVTTKSTASVLFISNTTTTVNSYKDEWYVDVYPDEENVVVGHFKFQETAWGTGSALFGVGSQRYIDEKNAYTLSFDYFDEDFPQAKITTQDELINALITRGNVAIKEGYASAYQEVKESERRYAAEKRYKEQCLDCEMDEKRTTLPSKAQDFWGYTYDKPGRFVTKNGQNYYYYYGKNEGFLVKGFIFDDKYDTWEKMYDAFYKACLKSKCPDYR